MHGTVSQTAEGYMARIEQTLAYEVNTVWAALTEPEQLVRWLADADMELVTGGRLQLRFNNTNSVIDGQITAVQPPTSLEFTWSSGGAAVSSRVRWELRPHQQGTCLVLSHTLLDYNQLAEMLAGWHTHLEGLPDAILGHHVIWPWDRWHELHMAYQEQLGHGDGVLTCK